jgi:hypothetical protein
MNAPQADASVCELSAGLRKCNTAATLLNTRLGYNF